MMYPQVVGKTSTSQTIDNADGNSLREIASQPTGAIVVQKVPATVPTTIAKKTRTP